MLADTGQPTPENQRDTPPQAGSSAPHQRPSASPQPGAPEQPAAKPRSRRGGRRPGAGAPKGNLNALKHGMHSKQLATIGKILIEVPEIRHSLLALADRQGIKKRKAERAAAALLTALFDRAEKLSGGRLNLQEALPELESIKRAATGVDIPEGLIPHLPRKYRREQSTPAETTKPQIQKPLD